MKTLQQRAIEVSAERTELANTHNTEWFPLDEQLSDGELLDNVIQYLEQVLEDTPPLLAYLSRDRKNHLYVSAHARFDLVRDLLNKITKEFR
jgi:hypothetical protein|tara:strand:+ start:379 stop:654 length:276 start_codon:yes stop_codon:yes gene_type:complete